MADLPPRYAYSPGPMERDPWGDPDGSALPPQELATRRWMLIIAAVGVGVLAVALTAVFVLGGGERPSFGGSVEVAPSDAAPASGAAAVGGAAQPTTAAANGASNVVADARALADARAALGALESQLKASQERVDDLDRRAAAYEQMVGITTRRAEAAEASLEEQRAERARFQLDLDAMNSELTQANADRAALRAQLRESQTLLVSSQASATDLEGTAAQLRSCLAVHEQALYYTTLENWGLLAVAMQDAAASCAAELG